MGIYDRDYYRQDRRAFSLAGPRTVVGKLILINAVIYLANWIITPPSLAYPPGKISYVLALQLDSITQPWLWWKLVTYGFAHGAEPAHVVLNMIGLWFLGPPVEEFYGSRRFLRFYLGALVFGSVVWVLIGKVQGADPRDYVLGASGAISAVVVLFAMTFPRQTVMFMFVLPMPAWVLGVIIVGGDAYRALVRPEGSNVAYTVHLAGAAFAFIYLRFGSNFGQTFSWFSPSAWVRRRPKLRVHSPEDDDNRDDEKLGAEVDRILEKISREGEDSLTRKERRTLETASREYQKRRRGG